MTSHVKKIVRSFSHAIRGIKQAFMLEYNFRIMVFLVLGSFFVIYFYDLELWRAIVILMSGFFMLAVELVNSSFERSLDLVTKYHDDNVKYIKDIMAGAALISSILWFFVLLLVVFY